MLRKLEILQTMYGIISALATKSLFIYFWVAVKDKADIDCVIFLNDVKSMEKHKDNLQETKDHLESCLKHSPYKDQITFGKQTPFAVKFRLDLSREFDIDLLPTFTTESPGEIAFSSFFNPSSIRVNCLSATLVLLETVLFWPASLLVAVYSP